MMTKENPLITAHPDSLTTDSFLMPSQLVLDKLYTRYPFFFESPEKLQWLLKNLLKEWGVEVKDD
jgi:hypothetical protein